VDGDANFLTATLTLPIKKKEILDFLRARRISPIFI